MALIYELSNSQKAKKKVILLFEISEAMSWQVRKKRAYLRLTMLKASNEIGISRETLRKIESGALNRTTKTVFLKITNWLLEEKEVN